MVAITALEIVPAHIQQAAQVLLAEQPELCDSVEP